MPAHQYTAPAVPTSGTTKQNVEGQAMLVQIMGGTVTVIAINGVTVGATSGLFLVPANGTIAVTYSVKPTWLWYPLPH